ncbi:c-type cytochrome [Roseiflexus sp.]|uniref:c-type cytochrome n=1 Tax=Roseiflexus sp. TaxID=2562120 RepID=UPI00398B2C23
MQLTRYRHVVHVLLLWLILLAGCGAVADQMASAGSVSSASTPTLSTVTQRTGDPQRGAALFAGDVKVAGFVACRGCHAVDPAVGNGLGPNLAGIALHAGSRIPGVAADEYIRSSILVHDDFIVPGFEAGLVRAVVGRDFGEILSDQDIADLRAYLLTLDQAPIAQAPTPDPSSSPTPSSQPVTVPAAPTATMPARASMDANPLPTSTATVEQSPSVAPSPTDAASPSPDNRAPTVVSPTIAATEMQSASATPSLTAASPTVPPSPTDSATSSPAPTPTQLPTLTATSAPATSNPSAAGDEDVITEELAVYTGCMTCHDQHPQSIVKMPHVRFPRCSSCHSGSPSRIGCPTCHSMHRIQAPHGGENPNLPCSHCHADR